MSITRIPRLDRFRIFRDFTWPGTLADFKKFNLIYGWNGSGKTTLSTLFRHLETRAPLTECSVTVSINNHDVHGAAFDTVTEPIRVFNRDFIAENVFTPTREVAPIHVIGKANIDKQKRIDHLKISLRDALAAEVAARAAHVQAVKAEDNFCIAQAKVIKDCLGGGGNRFSNYNKANFRKKAEALQKAGKVATAKVTDDEKAALLSQIRGSPKPTLAEIAYSLPDLPPLGDTASSLLRRTVLTATLESLRDAPAIAAWVRQGLGLHRAQAAKTCLFCTQSLPGTRLRDLEKHFSDEFERLQAEIDTFIAHLQSLVTAAESFTAPSKAELYDDIADEYNRAVTACRAVLKKVTAYISGLMESLRRKKASPFQAMELGVISPSIDTSQLDQLRDTIAKHNKVTVDFAARVEAAQARLEDSYVAEAYDEYAKLVQDCQTAKEQLDQAVSDSQSHASEIQTIEREIISHQEPAEQLNKDLRAYLGHDELQLRVCKTGYQITRKGQIASDLSEGERTAIAVLYFLRSLKDRSFDAHYGVVVLDDPVSSLDANALFNAFGFIKAHTQDVGQLFVLTHNFALFRAVREWLNNLRGPLKNEKQMYMLECGSCPDGRCACLREIDPLLREYESEYHYLFAYIYRITQQPGACNLAAYLPAPSIARRVLETFLAFRVPGKATLHGRMSAVAYDEAKRARIYRFVQTHAHRDAIGDTEDDLTILSETKSVLAEIIEFMRTADADHCRQLIEIAENRV